MYEANQHQGYWLSSIRCYYIHKNPPDENAVIERSFRTDQEEFFFSSEKPPEDINQLNHWFQNYLFWYNEKRPHFGINLKTPLEAVQTVSKVLKH